jgi:urea transport system substrate-binding protein
MSVKNPTNTKFKDQFAAWVKANNLPGGASA